MKQHYNWPDTPRQWNSLQVYTN